MSIQLLIFSNHLYHYDYIIHYIVSFFVYLDKKKRRYLQIVIIDCIYWNNSLPMYGSNNHSRKKQYILLYSMMFWIFLMKGTNVLWVSVLSFKKDSYVYLTVLAKKLHSNLILLVTSLREICPPSKTNLCILFFLKVKSTVYNAP